MAKPTATFVALGLAFAALLAFAPVALADTYKPNKLGDHTPNGCTKRDCTLREALIKANNHPGHDKIVVQGGKTYNLKLPGNGDDLAKTGDLDIIDPVTIRSSGPKRATIDAHKLDSVFQLPSETDSTFNTASATLSGLVITGGTQSKGGGIDDDASGGTLRLVNSVVRGNTASFGGGISDDGGSLRLIKSTVAANHASTDGGGIYTQEPTVVLRSTVSGNTADVDGGGILDFGTVTIRDSTIAGNRAAQQGGGIWATFNSTTNLNSDTVARNEADSDQSGGDSGGGIFALGSTHFTVANTLIALNTIGPGSGDTDPNCSNSAAFISGGHNLRSSADTGCTGFTGTGDLVNVTPKIGTLANNGGPTKTIALLKGSPAINHGGPDAEKRDQRGVLRGTKPDIGAYERR